MRVGTGKEQTLGACCLASSLPYPQLPSYFLDGSKLYCDIDFLTNKAHNFENPSEMWTLKLMSMVE